MYLQLIDDTIGHTLVSASHIDKQLRKEISRGSNIEAATKIAELLAKRAKEKGIDEVVFDRGGHLYHGRVKAVAETVRKAGLRC
jgi:large subunit ribosomal protein L18